jgi:hypothetical protein
MTTRHEGLNMPKPQQPELRRSGLGSTDQDSEKVRAGEELGSDGSMGPVPEENRPGHHPEDEQDKPDPDGRP